MGERARLVGASLGCAEVMARVHACAFPPNGRWDAGSFATLLATPGTFGFMDPDGVGFALARVAADEAELLTIAVAPAGRGHGRGAALLAAVMADAARRGAAALFLEVSADNGAARRLYERAGFVSIGRRSGYYADGGDALVMRRNLRPFAPAGA